MLSTQRILAYIVANFQTKHHRDAKGRFLSRRAATSLRDTLCIMGDKIEGDLHGKLQYIYDDNGDIVGFSFR